MSQLKRTFQAESNNLTRIERKKLILNQLHEILYDKGFNSSESRKAENSLNRLIHFLSNHTDIQRLSDIKREHFIQYMRYSIEVSFINVSLKELKKEIVLMQQILKGVTNHDARLDLSVNNFVLWTQLLPCKIKERKES